MNCQEFQREVDGLARGALMDATVRAEASAHEESCARCSALLANERALTAGLRALAAGTRGAESPARVETALLAAFRASAGSAGANKAVAAPVFAAAPVRGEVVRPWSWVKTVAAASLAAAAALAFYMLIPPDFSRSPAPRGRGEVAKAGGPTPSGASADGGTVGAAGPTVETPSRASRVAPPSEVAADSRNNCASSQLKARATNAVYASGGARGNSRGAQTAAQEVVTDFIPLEQGGSFVQSEASHIVRIELPRSALTSFGIPFNAESAGGRVKADVLLGEDGIARAIRFVR